MGSCILVFPLQLCVGKLAWDSLHFVRWCWTRCHQIANSYNVLETFKSIAHIVPVDGFVWPWQLSLEHVANHVICSFIWQRSQARNVRFIRVKLFNSCRTLTERQRSCAAQNDNEESKKYLFSLPVTHSMLR